MIQDIYPHRFDNHFQLLRDIHPNDYILYYQHQKLLLKKKGEELELPRVKDFDVKKDQVWYLFSLDDVPCYLLREDSLPLPEGFIYHEISFFRNISQKDIAWVGIVGFQLMNWYEQNQYCGRCGHRTRPKVNERAIQCESCQTTVYPKISPAIIVAIISGEKILLAHNSNFQERFYSLVAGYADIGESLEDAVRREVMEEVGIQVNDIRYYKSQPWPFSGSMMIGFIAEADDRQPIRVDHQEIDDAQWFTRDHLPNHPKSISIAGEMIEQFRDGKLK